MIAILDACFIVSWFSKLTSFAENTWVLENLNLVLPASKESAEIKLFMLVALFLFTMGKATE